LVGLLKLCILGSKKRYFDETEEEEEIMPTPISKVSRELI